MMQPSFTKQSKQQAVSGRVRLGLLGGGRLHHALKVRFFWDTLYVQSTLSQSGNDSKCFLKKFISQNTLMAHEARPPPLQIPF